MEIRNTIPNATVSLSVQELVLLGRFAFFFFKLSQPPTETYLTVDILFHVIYCTVAELTCRQTDFHLEYTSLLVVIYQRRANLYFLPSINCF